jgi:hypothetical protein
VIVPAVHVLMFLDTVRPSETAAILDSIEVTDTDVTGCPMRQSALRPPTHYHPADPGALSSSVIPLEPTSIAVCHYADSWLESAALSTGNGKDRLVSTADALPRGFAHAPPSSYLPSVCTDSAADGGGAGTGFELIAQYTDRSPVTLWAHVGFCGPLGITNGLRSGRLTPTLASALSAPLHIGYAVPGRLLPGPGSTP